MRPRWAHSRAKGKERCYIYVNFDLFLQHCIDSPSVPEAGKEEKRGSGRPNVGKKEVGGREGPKTGREKGCRAIFRSVLVFLERFFTHFKQQMLEARLNVQEKRKRHQNVHKKQQTMGEKGE